MTDDADEAGENAVPIVFHAEAYPFVRKSSGGWGNRRSTWASR